MHDLHNDYPLDPEKLEIGYNMLSKYCNGIANECGIKVNYVNKLFPNSDNSNKYDLDYRNLQSHFSLGMKMVKIYVFIMSFVVYTIRLVKEIR